jgi:hypothetical protein
MPWRVVERKIGRAGGMKQRTARQRAWDRKHGERQWAGGAEGGGALPSRDIIQVVPDRKHASFMHSFPNYIQLPALAIERIAKGVKPFGYDRVYGAFWDTVICQGGKTAVKRSAERYVMAMGESAGPSHF